MALWDALTGKILHFNKTKEQANNKVCTTLKTFVSSRLANYPNGEKMFVQGRNVLYAFYAGTTIYLSKNIDTMPADHRRGLLSLNTHSYLCLISSLHTAHVVGMYLGDRDSPAAQSWFYLLFEGICDIYGRPVNYMAEWINRLDWITESEESTAARLSYKVYDEIAPVLGLPQSNPIECMTWARIGLECTRLMRTLYDRPDWSQLVAAELAAH